MLHAGTSLEVHAPMETALVEAFECATDH
jgi:hypothetical protein